MPTALRLDLAEDGADAERLAEPTGATGPGADSTGQSAEPGGTPTRVAGELAILGAALLIAGLLPEYRGSESLWEKQSYHDGAKWYVWYACTMTALVLAAGISTLVPRTRRTIGPGLLLGVAAASTLGLAFLAPTREPARRAPAYGSRSPRTWS